MSFIISFIRQTDKSEFARLSVSNSIVFSLSLVCLQVAARLKKGGKVPPKIHGGSDI